MVEDAREQTICVGLRRHPLFRSPNPNTRIHYFTESGLISGLRSDTCDP